MIPGFDKAQSEHDRKEPTKQDEFEWWLENNEDHLRELYQELLHPEDEGSEKEFQEWAYERWNNSHE